VRLESIGGYSRKGRGLKLPLAHPSKRSECFVVVNAQADALMLGKGGVTANRSHVQLVEDLR
jgi:hypothetical protein